MKILKILSLFSILLISVYIFDKLMSENSSDAANIVIGISNVDSSSCLQCQEGGKFFDSGCKRCPQDNINFRTKTALDNPFQSSWSKDNGMFYGDNRCAGETQLPSIKLESDSKYWTEIHVIESDFVFSIYEDSEYSNKISSVENSMCSIPSELKFIRFSMNDGKPISNGGRIVGSIDNIEIYDSKKNIDSSKSLSGLNLIYEEDFSNCKTKTCNEKWILQNDDLFYIDNEKGNFHFDSFISGSNDYAHFELKDVLSSEWKMRLLLTINHVEDHPAGKGLLSIEPDQRNLFFIIPSVLVVLFTSIFSFKVNSRTIGILIMIFGTLLLFSSISPLISNFVTDETNFDDRTLRIVSAISIGIFLEIFGLWKLFSFKKDNYI